MYFSSTPAPGEPGIEISIDHQWLMLTTWSGRTPFHRRAQLIGGRFRIVDERGRLLLDLSLEQAQSVAVDRAQ